MNHFTFYIKQYLLPLGFFIFLTGLLFARSMSAYHTLIYATFLLPALLVLLLNIKQYQFILFSKLAQALLLLFILLLFSLYWNAPEVQDMRYAKPVLLIAVFIIGLIQINKPSLILNILLLSAICYMLTGLYSMLYFEKYADHGRLIGIGNLTNPLLSSHLYGIYATFIATYFVSMKTSLKMNVLLLIIFAGLMTFLFLTGSRTPFLGLFAVMIFLAVVIKKPKVIYLGLFLGLLFLIYLGFNYDLVTLRGLSHRPELWQKSFTFILQHPFLGFGIGTPLQLEVKSLGITFIEPHSIHLGFLYYLGFIGGVLWLFLLFQLTTIFYRNKDHAFAQISMAMLIYGLSAGMLEGGSVFSRPKEVWFLCWLPIALLFVVENIAIKKNY